MTRIMYDSTNPMDIPLGAGVVAYYVDGAFQWSSAGLARFPNAVKVGIAVFASTNDGVVLDVENGDATPMQATRWVPMRRSAGIVPSVYCNVSTLPVVRQAFQDAKVAEPYYWIANWDNVAVISSGAIAKQYADSNLIGQHYDLSIVADYWPGVDMTNPNSAADAAILGYVAGNNRVTMPDGAARNLLDVDYDITGRLMRIEKALTDLAGVVATIKAGVTPTTFTVTSTVKGQ